MSIFKCKMCGGALEVKEGETVAVCEYCGTKQTLPRLDDNKKANLYDRANHFRRNNDFDKAMGIYEQILNEDNTDAEAYWSLVLCRYGIEYVEDPSSHTRIPTVNRAQFTSIFADEDYKSALKYADSAQRIIYEDEAKKIDEIQKGFLEISDKEEPFDVFICYKETDNSGRRTPDSVLANDLYHQLTNEGFKVFFSRITLENKLGSEYEPYIFAALNSSKVMVVIGTKQEYFNAPWVKNEWSRYLALIKKGQNKMLIPAYKDMDPYDLPEEFSHLQAQDMSKLGFMQDLIRGIKKILNDNEEKTSVKETIVMETTQDSVAPLLKRAFMFLEDGDFDNANTYCERVLDKDPECAMAYLGKFMARNNIRKQEDIANDKRMAGRLLELDNDPNNPGKEFHLLDLKNYAIIMRFADQKLKNKLNEYSAQIDELKKEIKNKIYDSATAQFDEEHYEEAKQLFESVSGWKDADKKAVECTEAIKKNEIYADAMTYMNAHAYDGARERFESIAGWKDADEYISKMDAENKRKAEKIKKLKKITKKLIPIACVCVACIFVVVNIIVSNVNHIKQVDSYNQAQEAITVGDYQTAAHMYAAAKGYKDSAYLARINNFQVVSAGNTHTVGLKSDGTVLAVGNNGRDQCNVEDWKDIVAVSAGDYHTVGLKSDGTVLAVGNNTFGKCDVQNWKDIVAVSAGNTHTVGLKSDGTVVAVGSNGDGQYNVEDWKDIVAVSAGNTHTVGLKSDGTVVAVGSNTFGKCDVQNWKDIVAVSAGDYHTVGLKSDGTVLAVGNNRQGQCDVEDWRDIVAVSAGSSHTVGLKSDGTVLAVGSNDDGQCNVEDWKDIVAVSAGDYHTVGLKSDGTVLAVGLNNGGQCNVEGWKDIKIPGNSEKN